MAGDEAADGSWNRRQMDLNIYLGLPPLPRSPRLLAALDCPVSSPNSIGTAPVAPITDEPVELLTPVAVAYSPSNALSTPEEESMLDPYVYAWLDGHSTDGEEGTDAAEPDVVLGVTVDNASVPSSPSRVPAGLEGDDDLTLRMESFVHPGGVTDSLEMVSTVNLQNQGAVDLESTTPELRLLNLIRISQQHSIVRTGSANLHQQARSPEADRLSWAIKRSHDSLEVARRQKLDGDNKVREEGAVNKDDCCGCNSSFECNICLDEAKEPVVTPCGHLFCWPCLYTWLHAHSVHSECPVCKGEVLEVNVTPIYGRADDQRDASVLDMPPRPHANRKQSLGQQLQTADARRATTVVRQFIENMATATWRRPRAPSRRRQDTVSTIMLNTNSNQITLPPSGADNTASEVSAAPQQSSSVEQSSISSTAAVIVGEPVSSRRSRPSVSVDTRRIRRRQE